MNIKLLLFLLFVINSPSLTFAGLPEEDPTVKDIVRRFSSASRPEIPWLESLPFKCVQYSTIEKDFSVLNIKTPLTFSLATALYFNFSHAFSDVIQEVNGDFTSTIKEENHDVYFSFRSESNGTLIAEWAVKSLPSPEISLEPVIAYAKHNGAKVNNYLVCDPI